MNGRVGVVFGGAGGIGLAMVKMLLQHGCKVVFSDISDMKGREMESELLKLFPSSVHFSKCDVTEHEDINGVFNQAKTIYGAPSICINCAGISNEKEWRKVLRINLEGAFDVTQSALSAMSRENGANGGDVIHVASISGISPLSGLPAYSASKAGIIGFVRSFGTEEHLSVHGVRIHALCPGATITDIPSLIYVGGHLMDEPVPGMELLKTLFITGTKQPPEAVAEAARPLIEDREKNGQVVAVIGGKTYVEEETRAAVYGPLLFH